MNKAWLKNIVIVFLAGVAFFSIYRYALALRERYALLDTIKQLKGQFSSLEEQQQKLLQTLEKEKVIQLEIIQRNLELRDNLKAGRERLAKLFHQAYQTQKELEDLNAKFSVLKSESGAARQKNSELAQENEMLKAKFYSLEELQKAIRELKIQIRKGLRPGQKPRQGQPEEVISGNRGFLVKDGQLTFSPAKLIIEVVPAPQPDKAQ